MRRSPRRTPTPAPGSPRPPAPPSRRLLAVLVLACVTVMVLDVSADDSPVDPVRSAAAAVLGPIESGASSVVRPLTDLPATVRSHRALRAEVRDLERTNAELRRELARTALDRNRAAELDGLLAATEQTGYAVVPARVVGMGPAQNFTRTVTIDAGTAAGVRADQTVINAAGLVGRVLRADRHTATVLLVADASSVVGGRLASSMELGFVQGRGDVGGEGLLDLDLADGSVVPARGDVVVTWGSRAGAPYVAGIPIGTVQSVQSNPRDLTRSAIIEPLADFTSLDLVGVVVPADTESDRTVLGAEDKP